MRPALRWLPAFLATSLAAQTSAPSTATLLREAVYAEQTRGDLAAAIASYELVIERSGSRQERAVASYRLAGCYLAQGQAFLDRGKATLQQLIERYPAETALVAAARERLSTLSVNPSGPRIVSLCELTDTHGSFSPDGRYLSVTEWVSGNLGVRDLTTGSERMLTRDASWEAPERTTSWSVIGPDNTTVAYAWHLNPGSELRLIGIDGTRARVVFSDLRVRDLRPVCWLGHDHVVVATEDPDGACQLEVVALATGHRRVLAGLGRQEPSSTTATCSPDGRWVVYNAPRDGAPLTLYLVPANGGEPRQLLELAALDHSPSWSPDGRWIVFASNRRGSTATWGMAMDGDLPVGEPILLDNRLGSIWRFGFLADGSYVYGKRDTDVDVFAVDFDSARFQAVGTPKRISRAFPGTNSHPSWSPDGGRLAYWSTRRTQLNPNAGTTLVVQDLATGSERELASIDMRWAPGPRQPQWTPDGRALLVTYQSKPTGRAVRIVDATTGAIRELPRPIANALQAAPTSSRAGLPSRTDAAFVGMLLSPRRLVEYRNDTQETREIFTGHSRWIASTSSSEIITLTSDGFWLVATDGRAPRRIYSRSPSTWPLHATVLRSSTRDWLLFLEGADDGKPWLRVRPTGEELTETKLPAGTMFTLHPNGRRLAFSRRGDTAQRAQIWALRGFLPATEPKKR